MKLYKPFYKAVRVTFSKVTTDEGISHKEEMGISIVDAEFSEVSDLIRQLYETALTKPQKSTFRDRVKITIKGLAAPDGKNVRKSEKLETSYSVYGIEVSAIKLLIERINEQ